MLAIAHGTLIRHTLAALSGHDARHYPRFDNLSASHLHAQDAVWQVQSVGGRPFDEVRLEIDARAAEDERAA